MHSPQHILKKAGSLTEFAPKTIHFSYRLFIDYFDGEISYDKIFSGAYMVYGWMPTMLRLKGPTTPVVDLAYAARIGKVDEVLLSNCAKTLNNSLVGTTKLLHFLAPSLYPIWDSRVYRALFNEHPYPYRVENPITYLKFLDWCGDFEKLSGFLALKNRFELEASYPVSNKRVTEGVLYALGAKPKRSKGI